MIGGVNPKRAGDTHDGLPIFGSAVEATKHMPCDVTVIFIPPAMAKDAIIDAIDAGIGTIVTLTEHIPGHDVLEI
ncbi:succinate--CoA ligase subunit alpha, partial [Staphylococcus pseudintermedius]|nr:succinate--CoA ligase subunit alpha [Staphylococcus pseudintermedius]